MDKQYKPLSAPDKKAYEPYIKPKYVSDDTPKTKKPFKRKATPKPLVRLCPKCHNIISSNGYCDFCDEYFTVKIYQSALSL